MKLEPKFNEYKKKIWKFSETRNGRKIIFIGLVCFIAGMLWKLLVVTALIILCLYILNLAFGKKHKSDG